MKNKIEYPTNYLLGLRNLFLVMLIGMICSPVYGQLSERNTEDRPVVNSSRIGSGEVISIRRIKLKPDVSTEVFEQWVVDYFNPAWEGLIPGVRSFVTSGDERGDAIGEYAYLIIYDSLKSRNAYLPKDGSKSDWFNTVFYEPNKHLFGELMEFIEEESFNHYSSWVVLR